MCNCTVNGGQVFEAWMLKVDRSKLRQPGFALSTMEWMTRRIEQVLAYRAARALEG